MPDTSIHNLHINGLTFHYDRAVEIVHNLITQLKKVDYKAPEDIVTDELREDPAVYRNYLFLSSPLAPAIQGDTLYRKMLQAFEDTPALFDPRNIAKFYPMEDHPWSDLTGLLQSRFSVRHTGFDTLKSWIKNSHLLVDKYDGDPLNLLKQHDTVTGAIKGLEKEVYKYGPKTASMYVISCIRNNLMGDWSPVDYPSKFPLPSDSHTQELFIWNGGITSPEEWIESEKFNRILREGLLNVTENEEISVADLHLAIYYTGTQFCNYNRHWDCGLVEKCLFEPRGEKKSRKGATAKKSITGHIHMFKNKPLVNLANFKEHRRRRK